MNLSLQTVPERVSGFTEKKQGRAAAPLLTIGKTIAAINH